MQGGGEMGVLARSINWFTTPLGNPEEWPAPLKTMVSTTLENKIGMYIAWGKEYTQIYNDAYRPILGRAKHPKAMGISTKETFSEIWETIGPMFEEVMNGKSVGFPDFMLPLERNGFVEECYFDFSYSPIRLENGEVGGVLVTVIETTEKIKSIRQIKESEEKFQFAIDAAELGTWDLDPKTRKFNANPRLRKMFGFIPEGEIEFKFNVILESDRERVVGEMNRAFQKSSGGIYDIEYTIIDPDSALPRKIRAKGKTTFNENDEPIRFNGVLEDITDHEIARQAVIESESNLRNLVMNAPVAICVFKGENYITEIANDSMLELMGKSREEIINKPIFESLHEVSAQGLESILEGVYTSGKNFSATERPLTLPRNGSIKLCYINFIYEPFRDGDGNITGVIAVALDVTEHVEARIKIEESEERARLAIESSKIGTFDLDMINDKLITSDRLNSIYGLDHELSHEEFVNICHPEDRPKRDKAFQEALQTGNLTYEIRVLLKDKSIKWIRAEGKIFFDREKRPYRLIGTVLDITTAMDVQRQKDDFLAIASHELKTPLTSVKGYTQILSSLVKKGDQVTSLNILKKTERQVNKMTKLIHNFLDVSKLETSNLQLHEENFDLNELVSETINYFNLPDNKERLKFKTGDLPVVKADRSKIGHVIDNFISNALKYSSKDKLVQIQTECDKTQVIFKVKDQGVGINETSKEKIFQRFYRADNVKNDSSSGFGIGLYLSSEIIKLHKGKVWFESNEGQGSTFYFSLPIE